MTNCWQRFLLPIGLLASLAGLASHADDRRDPTSEQIEQLRQDLGRGFQTPAGAQEFSEALQQATDLRERWSNQRIAEPSNAWNAPPKPQAYAHDGDFNQAGRSAPYPQGYPKVFDPGFAPNGPPHRDPKTLLRQSAFELDKLAHRLELAELVEASDSVRRAANELRQRARSQGRSRGRVAPPDDNRRREAVD